MRDCSSDVLTGVLKSLKKAIQDHPSAELCMALHAVMEDYRQVPKTQVPHPAIKALQETIGTLERRLQALEVKEARKPLGEGARALVARMG